MDDLEERQITAVIGVILFGLVVPVLWLVVSVLVYGWLSVAGVHDVHGHVFGWVSDRSITPKGRTVYSIGPIVLEYYVGLVSVYLVYQLAELIWAGFGAFRRALT